MNILALDVGTSSIKAAVLDVAKTLPVGPIARVSYTLDTPAPEAAEVTAAKLWNAVAAAARSAVHQSGVSGKAGEDGDSCFFYLPAQPLHKPVQRDDVVTVIAQRWWSNRKLELALFRHEIDGFLSNFGVKRCFFFEAR